MCLIFFHACALDVFGDETREGLLDMLGTDVSKGTVAIVHGKIGFATRIVLSARHGGWWNDNGTDILINDLIGCGWL